MEEILLQEFPSAVKIADMAQRSFQLLTSHGYTPENTLFGTCICRDEINGPTAKAFSDIWGDNFRLGGLAGYPSCGLTGMSAYLDHAPCEDHYFILFGSHIGISETGELGVLKRSHRMPLSPACGSLSKSMMQIQNREVPAEISPIDVEQNLVAIELDKRLEEKAQDMCLKEFTYFMVEVIDSLLAQFRELNGGKYQVSVLGGVTINTSAEYSDYFLPLQFTVESEGKSVEVLSEL